MEYHADWLLRRLQMCVEAVARVVFGRERVEYTQQDAWRDTQSDALHAQVFALLRQGRVGSAEDALFAGLRDGRETDLWVALDFYATLNAMSDAQLLQANFPREEVTAGLEAVLQKYQLQQWVQ